MGESFLYVALADHRNLNGHTDCTGQKSLWIHGSHGGHGIFLVAYGKKSVEEIFYEMLLTQEIFEEIFYEMLLRKK